MSNFIYQVYSLNGEYKATVGKEGAKKLAKRIGGYVLRRPCGDTPVFDFRDKFLASESEQQTPSGVSNQEEKGAFDGIDETERYEVYDGNETMLCSFKFADAAKDEARRIAGVAVDSAAKIKDELLCDYRHLELGVYFDGELLAFHETIESAHAHARKEKAVIVCMDGDDVVLSNYCVPALECNYYVAGPEETYWYVAKDPAFAHAEAIDGRVTISHRGETVLPWPPEPANERNLGGEVWILSEDEKRDAMKLEITDQRKVKTVKLGHVRALEVFDLQGHIMIATRRGHYLVVSQGSEVTGMVLSINEDRRRMCDAVGREPHGTFAFDISFFGDITKDTQVRLLRASISIEGGQT